MLQKKRRLIKNGWAGRATPASKIGWTLDVAAVPQQPPFQAQAQASGAYSSGYSSGYL